MSDQLFEDFGNYPEEFMEPVVERREMCTRCIRPQRVCLCESLPRQPLAVRTKVMILQHPREEIRGLRTVPLLEACLEPGTVEVIRGKRFPLGRCARLDAVVKDPDTLLLYPSKSAVDIPTALTRCPRPRTLLVLDGTWKQAKGLFARHDYLHNLPAVALSSTMTSAYVIRTQPSDTALSTLESVAMALASLEDRQELVEEMVRPLRALCDIQLEHGAVVHHSRETLLRMEEEQKKQLLDKSQP